MRLQQEEAPEPVDDARHRRHQVDERDEARAQLGRRVLADVQGGQEGEREADGQCDERHLDGPDEHGGETDDVVLGVPLRLGEEAESVALQGRDRLVAEERADREDEDEHESTDGSGGAAEDAITSRQDLDDAPGDVRCICRVRRVGCECFGDGHVRSVTQSGR